MFAAALAFSINATAKAGGLRPLFDKFFEAWHGSDPQKVLGFFTEGAVVNLWGDGSTLNGRKAIGAKWIAPTMKKYPGNVHHVRNFLEIGDQAVIEWLFEGVDVTTQKKESDPGCSLFWVKDGLITRGHLYYNAA